MFREVSAKVSFPELETKILAFWKEHDIFRKSVEGRPEAPLYVFYEGPPTANGTPGIHHVLARVFKDVIPRYRTMKGYRVPRKGGWDTHGLPVELEIEKELGLAGKPEIEAYGVARFNEKCKESVFRYVQAWERMSDRIGFWLDMEDPYVTFHNRYIESCWWILKQLWDRGLVYQDYKVTPHCPRCGTTLSSHEVALGYKDNTDDPSVYVKFRLTAESAARLAQTVDGGRWAEEGGAPLPLGAGHPAKLGEGTPQRLPPPISFLVWTTTPWTLPGNAALAVNPDAEYSLVRAGDAVFVLASERVGAVLKEPGEELARVRGVELVGLTYLPLYRFLPLDTPAHRVVAADFVSLTDGTGIVHIAPAFGEVDLELGRRENLPVIQTVDLRGNMVPQAGPFAGLFVKKADPLISRDLTERGLMYRNERIRHTYPFCWRCDTPLLYYAKTSWYIRTTAVKDRLLANNELINWVPEHIKHGRFGNWLENNIDWAFSRERYWGTPVPIWRCAGCGAFECLGSVAELAARTGRSDLAETLDLHRPYIDELTWACGQCGGEMRRVPEVMDAWYDSGAMPYAQWHYPFENQEIFQERFPADFICEAVDQTRGWFYTLHALATLLYDSPCYRNVICLGLILDEKGEKMSKSRGNVVDPWSVLNVHGADALRWYLYTATRPGDARRFSAELVAESLRKFLLTLWNTYSFFVTYANLDGWTPSAPRVPLAERASLDRWILSELQNLIVQVDTALDRYDPTGAGRAIGDFVDDLSNWYVRRSRRRFWKSENDADKAAAYATLYECLVAVAQLAAPFVPFVTEEIYQNLVREQDAAAPESVHLTRYPAADLNLVDQTLVNDTRLVMRLVSLGRSARAKANLKVRQPLAEMWVKVRDEREQQAVTALAPQILEELNVKALHVAEDLGQLVTFSVKPNLPVLGPKYGREVGRITQALGAADPAAVAAAVRAGRRVALDGFEIEPEEVLVESRERAGLAVAEEAGYAVALSTALTPELVDEGLARELVHRLQTMRRNAGFEIADPIRVTYQGDETVRRVLETHAPYIREETLARELEPAPPPPGAHAEEHRVDGRVVTLAVERV